MARQGLGARGAESCKRQRRWYSSLQGHSDEEPGGVTRRPNPKRARGVILAVQKGRRNGERPPGSRESVLLRGRRRNENLGQLDKPSTAVSRKGALSKGAAERGAAEETPNLSQQRVGDEGRPAGNRGGALTQCASPSLDSVGPEGFRFPRKRGSSLSGSPRNDRLLGDGQTANARERGLREGRDDPMRVRISALEGVPVRRI